MQPFSSIEHEHNIIAAVVEKQEIQIYRRKHWITKLCLRFAEQYFIHSHASTAIEKDMFNVCTVLVHSKLNIYIHFSKEIHC